MNTSSASANPGRTPTFARLRGGGAPLFKGANIIEAGEYNRSLVLQAIRAHGPIERIEISRLIHLTTPAVYKIAADLTANGLIMAIGKSSGEKGAPAASYVINPDGAFSLGFNIDRDHLSLVMLDFAGNVRAAFHREIMFPDPSTARQFFADASEQLKAREPNAVSKLTGIGISIPDDLGTIEFPHQPPSFRNWSEVALADLLAGAFEVPVCIENDAASAAIGEMYFGGGLSADTFFYVLITAGLGGGLIVNRHYYRGAHGRSGEIGYLPQINPFRGRLSNLQETLGDAVLLTDLYERLADIGIQASSPEHLLDIGEAGEVCINAWIGRIADLLYVPILGILFSIDPDAVFVGGRLPKPVLERLCLELSKRVSLNVGADWPQHAVRPAQLSEYASAIGAAVLSFKSLMGAK